MAGKRDIVPLDGTNYATWKVQCKMTLMKEGVWNIVNGLEVLPEDQNARLKYYERRDKALAIIVLNVKTSLLYLLGDPVDPKEVWLKIQDQFQKKSWANKLILKRKSNALKLKDGETMQGHVKAMMEIFDELSIIGDLVDKEDQVVSVTVESS